MALLYLCFCRLPSGFTLSLGFLKLDQRHQYFQRPGQGVGLLFDEIAALQRGALELGAEIIFAFGEGLDVVAETDDGFFHSVPFGWLNLCRMVALSSPQVLA